MKGMADKMVNNHDLFEALEALERERGVKTEAVIDSIKNAIAVAVRKYYNVGEDNVEVEIDSAEQKFRVAIVKDIVILRAGQQFRFSKQILFMPLQFHHVF